MAAGLATLCLSGGALADQVCDHVNHEASSPTSRFTDNADGTVTDIRAKLMWTRCSAGQTWSGSACAGASRRHTWEAARAHADDVNRRGTFFYNDWRLPTLPELAMITERQCINPRVNAAVFPQTALASYWTTTSRPGAGDIDRVYVMHFDVDGIEYVDKAQLHHVRLVRSAL